ncbi:MAG TPA: hypothetical protein VIT38_09395 [Allosphingosinicella sp.]
MHGSNQLVAYAFPVVALGGPLLLGLWGAVRGLTSPAPSSRGRRDWKLVFASAFTYALAFNLIFFIQELFLVLPKATVPGLEPTLYHNNHHWQGSDPIASLYQGTGALAILVTGCLFALWLRLAPPRSAGRRLFVLWMAFHGFFQSLPQVVVGAILPGNDVGMAMDYLALSPTAKTIAAFAALFLMSAIGLRLTWQLLSSAGARSDIDSPGKRTSFVFFTGTLPALIGILLILPCRVPGSIDQVVLVPVFVAIIGMAWIQAGAWRLYGAPAGDTRPVQRVREPAFWLLVVFTIFQLVLRPGIPFF